MLKRREVARLDQAMQERPHDDAPYIVCRERAREAYVGGLNQTPHFRHFFVRCLGPTHLAIAFPSFGGIWRAHLRGECSCDQEFTGCGNWASTNRRVYIPQGLRAFFANKILDWWSNRRRRIPIGPIHNPGTGHYEFQSQSQQVIVDGLA